MTDRQPRWVYESGEEPDPRYSLANERTFLAWVRTSLALLAGGIALEAIQLPATDWARHLLAIVLVLFGGTVTVLALVRWARIERAMRTGQPLPSFQLGFLLTGAVVVGAVLVALTFV
jgi:putative membrane protein